MVGNNVKKYTLIPLIELDREIQLQVLNIRNEERIREWMFTQDTINTVNHFAWIERLKDDQSQICLIITNEKNQPLGSVNIKKIDKKNRTAELGFYKTQTFDEKGLMTKSLSTIINYSFDALGLEKIYTEVFEGNFRSINIHKKLLFAEEGFLRSHIIKEDVRIGVHLFGLMKNEWQVNKNKINIPDDIVVTLI